MKTLFFPTRTCDNVDKLPTVEGQTSPAREAAARKSARLQLEPALTSQTILSTRLRSESQACETVTLSTDFNAENHGNTEGYRVLLT